MPTNRTRRSRSWQPQLDDYKRQSLLEGPDAPLLAGHGYLRQAGSFAAMSPEDQAEAMAEMERDWQVHREELMAWWNAGADAPSFSRKPWIFPHKGTPDTLPWAAEQFDE